MKILAADTSAKTASAALCEDTRALAVYTQNVGFTQSETMLPMIRDMLKSANVGIDDIDMLACTVGPGSFTGVRIGVSLIKGLAFGKNKICVGVSSLEALARNVDIDNSTICAVIDARQNRLYNALFYYNDGTLARLCEDRVTEADELARELSNISGDVYFVGDGYSIMKKAFPAAKNTPSQLAAPSGYSVARAALEKYENASKKERAEFTDALLRPEYLRPSQAERTLSGKE